MKPTRLLTLITVFALLGPATRADAYIGFNPISDPNIPAGFVSHEVLWLGAGDWTSAGMLINLFNGSVYNNTLGGDSPPSSAILGFFPELEFDTYVGIIDDGLAGIAGGCGDCGGGPLSMDAPQISVSWFNSAGDDIGIRRIGMITLSEDAQGTYHTVAKGVANTGVLIDGSPGLPGGPAIELRLEPTQPDIIPGYTAYEVFHDGLGIHDWRNVQFNLDLTRGSVYNDPTGGDAAPTSAQIAGSPDLAFDTYLGVIDDTTGTIVGGNFDSSIPLSLSGPSLRAYWSNLSSNERGLTKIGNITLSNDALGTWSLTSAGTTITGEIVPEPASLALLAVACPMLLRRR